jgi:hypothetical protein
MLANLRALALLGFALLGPARLPAGGADLRLPEVRRRQSGREPLCMPEVAALRCSPQRQAPVIAEVAAGVPLRPLRRWCTACGQRWLQVELAAGLTHPAVASPRRGWLLEAET